MEMGAIVCAKLNLDGVAPNKTLSVDLFVAMVYLSKKRNVMIRTKLMEMDAHKTAQLKRDGIAKTIIISDSLQSAQY